MRTRLALLDLDGTLVDSAPDLWVAANGMLRGLGRGPISQRQVRCFVGNGLEPLVHRCLSGDFETNAAAQEFEPALALFTQLYGECNGRHARLYSGVTQGLVALRDAGILRACVTNKPRDFTLALLDATDLHGFMDLVIGGDEVRCKKPSPEALLRACSELDVPPAESVMLGDSSNDVIAARAAGMRVGCVDYGYNHGRDIRTSGPDAVSSRLDELVEKLIA